jgi:uncharacterized protein YutE (UPF0331/DUF86 family)
LAESFARLQERGVLSRDTAEALAKAAGLRNVVARAYASVDVAIVHAAATTGVHDIDRLACEVSEWLARQS